MEKYTWLFGENLGETANNNSFYFWLEIVNKNDGIDKYFVLSRNHRNEAFVNSLPGYARQFVCWKNSLQHFKLWYKSAMYFVSLSYRDVRPNIFFGKRCNLAVERPVIYLQHGILGIKMLGYNGRDYNNNMFRFVYYNKQIKDELICKNGFKEYQLHYGEYMPRFKALATQYLEDSHVGLKLFFFPTWREYFGNNDATGEYINTIKKVIEHPSLNDYLKSNNAALIICLHSFFDKKLLDTFNVRSNNSNITIKTPVETDVLHEIATSDVCITDYSSVGFDFTLLNKPVILFQPDRDAYLLTRKLYCKVGELRQYSIKTVEELADIIINKKYMVNEFFRKRLPENIDLQYIRHGKHIEKMYEYFYKLQTNSIVFLGYNFYGIGGTVNATHALAEGLLEKGCLVSLISLKRQKTIQMDLFPQGLNMRCFLADKSSRKLDILKRLYNKLVPGQGYFEKDEAKKGIGSYRHYALKKFLKNSSFKYYVSTRETIHLYLDDAKSISRENKYYFYHTVEKAVDDIFPGVMKEIVKRELDNAIFVTGANQSGLKHRFGFANYKKSLIIGNSLSSNRCLNEQQLRNMLVSTRLNGEETGQINRTCPENNRIRGLFLLRIVKERKKDLQELFNFGVFLKDNNVKDVIIDVYGDGNFKERFIALIIDNGLQEIIAYKGTVANPRETIIEHDFVIDFSEAQSFGMTYIEAILNGRMIFCKHNTGSDEVLKTCPECYYSSFSELLNKIRRLEEYNKNALSRYQAVSNQYSRVVVAEKFISFVGIK